MNSEPVSQAQQEHNYERITRDVTNDVMKLHLNKLQLNFGVIRAIRTGTYGEKIGDTGKWSDLKANICRLIRLQFLPGSTFS